jgi:hypothetical protein
MPESNLIIDNKEFRYSGIFSVTELLNKVNELIDQLGYQRFEKKSEEKITSKGREFFIELRPYKDKTNYVRLMIKIKLHLTNVTDVEKEVGGMKKTFQQGNVHLVLDAWSLTDYESRWGMKPFTYFLKAVINKFIYKFPMEEQFMSEIGSDGMALYYGIVDFLQNYVYEQGLEKKEEIVPVTEIPLEKKKRT